MNLPDVPLNSHNPLDALSADGIVSSVVSSSEAVREMMAQSSLGIAQAPETRPLHRLASVRKDQGVSLTRAAKRLEIDIAEARRQERATTDLLLSQLYRWRTVLEVPVGDLVIEPDEIPSNPIKSRSQLIRMMKTVRAILENTKEEGIGILAKQLVDLLIELMPELKSISAWPNVGQARDYREPGQAALRRFDPSVSRRLEE